MTTISEFFNFYKPLQTSIINTVQEYVSTTQTEEENICYGHDHDDSIHSNNGSSQSDYAFLDDGEWGVSLSGDDPTVQTNAKNNHSVRLGQTFELDKNGKAEISIQAKIDSLIGEADNDRLGQLVLKQLNEDGNWEKLNEKALFRGRFGNKAYQKFGFEESLNAGTYKVEFEGSQEVNVRTDYSVNFKKNSDDLTAVTWNMLWEKEPMNPNNPASAMNYTKAMSDPGSKGGWDADVIFFQEVDKGDRGYDNHHVINMIDDGLNQNSEKRQWSLSWAYDDKNSWGRVNSYLVTNIKREKWMDSSGGKVSFGTGSWDKFLNKYASVEGTDAAKGHFTEKEIEDAGGWFRDNPGDHNQMGNSFHLGDYWGYDYYMNVNKAKMKNGEVVYLANLHLKSGSSHADLRREEIDQAMKYLKKLAASDPDYDGRILLAGDFNTYNIKKSEGEDLVKRMRNSFGYAVDASMASEFKSDPNQYMEKQSDWKDGKVPETWAKVPTFIGGDGSIKGGDRFDAFVLLGEGWKNDMISDFHWAGPKEFEIHRDGNYVPDTSEYYNHGKPIADSDHLPGRVKLSIGLN